MQRVPLGRRGAERGRGVQGGHDGALRGWRAPSAGRPGLRREPGREMWGMRRILAFLDGPGRLLVLAAIVLMFARIFLQGSGAP